jgi:hypothetical protein
MTISELMEHLQTILDNVGDLPVTIWDDEAWAYWDVETVDIHDRTVTRPDLKPPFVEIR